MNETPRLFYETVFLYPRPSIIRIVPARGWKIKIRNDAIRNGTETNAAAQKSFVSGIYGKIMCFSKENEREKRAVCPLKEPRFLLLSLCETVLRRVFYGNAATHANDSLFERRRKSATSFLCPPRLLQRKSSERTLYRKNVVVSE